MGRNRGDKLQIVNIIEYYEKTLTSKISKANSNNFFEESNW